jgi:hypothetical protein
MLENKLKQWTIIDYEEVYGWRTVTLPFDRKEKAEQWLKNSLNIHKEPIYPNAMVVDTLVAKRLILESKIEIENQIIKRKKRLVGEYKKELKLVKEKIKEENYGNTKTD